MKKEDDVKVLEAKNIDYATPVSKKIGKAYISNWKTKILRRLSAKT